MGEDDRVSLFLEAANRGLEVERSVDRRGACGHERTHSGILTPGRSRFFPLLHSRRRARSPSARDHVMSAEAQVLAPSRSSQWIANPRWDLVTLTLSAALVAVPPLVHTLGKTTAGGVDLLITLLIGGPHMYATFLKTIFEPRFRQVHPALTWAPVVVVPIGVVLGAVYAFPWLLTFFFTWASIHVCDQASYIGYLYREKGGAARPWQRLLDFSVVITSLYSYAMYRHVAGTFRIGDTTLWFPAFLKHTWFADSFAVFTAALIAAWVVFTANQIRRRELATPYAFFMALTIAVALLVPRLPELSISFQGFNAWHSFQYLGRTYL